MYSTPLTATLHTRDDIVVTSKGPFSTIHHGFSTDIEKSSHKYLEKQIWDFKNKGQLKMEIFKMKKIITCDYF